MPAFIGLLMLMGVVTKNSILLVEYAIMARREHGMSRFDALVDACHKRSRPILMTTIAMGAGMLPIAVRLGADPSFRQPMAIVVIGGLLTSTMLSLIVIPVLFTYVDDLLKNLRRGIFRDRSQPSFKTDKFRIKYCSPIPLVRREVRLYSARGGIITSSYRGGLEGYDYFRILLIFSQNLSHLEP